MLVGDIGIAADAAGAAGAAGAAATTVVAIVLHQYTLIGLQNVFRQY